MKLIDYFRSALVRIVAAYTCLFAISVIILLGVVYWLTTKELREQLRSNIQADAAALVELHRQGGRSALNRAIEARLKGARERSAAYIYQTMDGDRLAGIGAAPPPFEGWRELKLVEPCHDCDADDDSEDYLGLGIVFKDTGLIVAHQLDSLDAVQEVLLRSFGWTLGLTVMLALAGGIFLGHGALRRVDAINRATGEIVAGNLSQRLPVIGAKDELDVLAANINHMLDRIGQLMANLQQVTNDIAHDLRTPLGRLRQRLETARDKDLTVTEHRSALDDAIKETDAILETFAALLGIAQIESRARRERFTDVDLSETAGSVVDAYETVAEDHNQHLEGRIEQNIRIRGDRDLLAQLLANLIENAIRHCPAGTDIVLSLEMNAGRPVLCVADNGPGIPAEDREKVLDRFYRVEQSRTTPGSGLGLALVKAVADLHDASLALADNAPGLRVTLRFG
jgi:signal transduction histidine kinase